MTAPTEARPPKWLEEQISKALAKLNALPPERQIPYPNILEKWAYEETQP